MAGSEGVSKTLVLTGHGGYDVLQVQDKPKPVPQEGEVLVEMRACGINFAELMARQGMYDRAQKTPCVLGFEGAGEVVSLGPGVTEFKVGSRVICCAPSGLWVQYAAVPVTRCFAMPEGMTYEEGAAIPVNYVTAYHMLFDMGNLRPGKSVLIHMVAGGVGNAAVQLCRSVDDVTIFGTCSAAKHPIMKKAGVDHPIDYRTQDYSKVIGNIAPKGVDIVLDPLSGADSVKGYNLLKPLGTIIHFGAATMVTGPVRNLWQAAKTWWNTTNYNPLSMMSRNKCVAGYHMGHLINNPETIQDAVAQIFQLYKEGKVKPVIDSVWPLEDVRLAMARMHDRKNVGKVVLAPQKTAGSGEILSDIK